MLTSNPENEAEREVVETLRRDPEVLDVAVVGQVAFVAVRERADKDAVRERLLIGLSSEGKTFQIQILPRLPLDELGKVDVADLAGRPLVDRDLLERLTEEIEALPGVRRAACRLSNQGPGTVSLDSLEGRNLCLPGSLPFQSDSDDTGDASGGDTHDIVGIKEMGRPRALVESDEVGDFLEGPRDLFGVLEGSAQRHPNKELIFRPISGPEQRLSFSELRDRANRVAAALAAVPMPSCRAAILLCQSNHDLVLGFWACIRAGITPLIVPVPVMYDSLNRQAMQLRRAVELLEDPLVLADESAFGQVHSHASDLGLTPSRLLSIASLDQISEVNVEVSPDPDAIAFYVLTSGSTGKPKLIGLTHWNVISRARGANRLVGFSPSDRILNWLPFDHIGTISDWHIRCIDLGCEMVYVDKELVIAEPARWLNLLASFQATHSWAPNFAFAAAIKGIDAVSSNDRDGWDLKCVRSLLTAGETVSSATMNEFVDALSPYGLRPDVFLPAFGMAEMGSGTTYSLSLADSRASVRVVSEEALRLGYCADVSNGSPGIELTSLGGPIPGIGIRICDDEGDLVDEGIVGRFQVRGDAVFKGYYRDEEATKEAFTTDGWFDTGDKGFILDRELYLTGRSKETIVINGANYYPAEIESIVESLPGISASFCAAFSVPAEEEGREQLVILFHSDLPSQLKKGLLAEVRREVVRAIGIAPDVVFPVEREDIEKTAIGKLQRKAMAQKYREGGYADAIDRASRLGVGGEKDIADALFTERWVPMAHAPAPVMESQSDGSWILIGSETEAAEMNAISLALEERKVEVFQFGFTGDGESESAAKGVVQWQAELQNRLSATWSDALLGLLVVVPFDSMLEGELALYESLGNLLKALSTALSLDVHLPVSIVRTKGAIDVQTFDPGLGLRVWTEAIQSWRACYPWFEGQVVEVEQILDGDQVWEPLRQGIASPSSVVGDPLQMDADGTQRLVSERIDLLSQEVMFEAKPPQDLLVVAGDERLTEAYCVWAIGRHGCRVRLLALEDDGRRAESLSNAIVSRLKLELPEGQSVENHFSLAADFAQGDLVEWSDALKSILANVNGVAMLGVFRKAFVGGDESSPQYLASQSVRWNRFAELAYQRLAASNDGYFEAITRRAVSDRCGLDTILSGISQELGRRLSLAGIQRVSVCLAELRADEPCSRSASGEDAWREVALTPENLVVLASASLSRNVSVLRVGGCVPDRKASSVAVYYCADEILPDSFWLDRVFRDDLGTPVPCEFVQLRDPRRTNHQSSMEWWPSVADYFVYDELIYHALTHDERRNESYKLAIRQLVKGKTVVDVGTGKEAILARFCVEAGAAKVYALEIGDEAFDAASELLERLELTDRIEMVKGDARRLELPELCDVCISEIVGPIGGCEGASPILNDCRRFLKTDGAMIPCRSETRIAAVTCPDELLDQLGFNEVPGSYVKKIYDDIGHPMDLRMCIKQFPHSHIVSDSAIYEDLDFSQTTEPNETHSIRLNVTRSGRLDGFLIWLNLHTIEGEVIDIIEHEYSWLPVYFPVFWPGVTVAEGDWIDAECERRVSSNGVNPDYLLRGVLHRANGESVPFQHEALHHDGGFKGSPFYQKLFGENPFGRLPVDPNEAFGRYMEDMVFDAAGHPDGDALAALAESAEGNRTRGRAPQGEVEQRIASIWCDLLSVDAVGVEDSFFELGGHSLLLVQAEQRLNQCFQRQVSLIDLFKYSTVEALAEYLDNSATEAPGLSRGAERAEIRRPRPSSKQAEASREIAVIGMACRYPGAENPESFWENLKNGVESVSFFSDEEILASGVDPRSARDPRYVKGNPIIEGVEWFDAGFFDVSEREAKLMDPQQRLFLECAWEALEDAGYDSSRYGGSIGVFGGASMSTYLLNNVFANRDRLDANDDLDIATLDSMGGFQLMVANDKDYLTTRVSYKMDLRGPSVNVQTACSTSLVAIHQAVQSILSGECDMALAGGVAVKSPQKVGHLFQEGMIVSSDGHCRAFDEKADGTVFGSGSGIVVLKSLEAAVRDRDNIYAVIKGSAVNNDGGAKVGYMAPNGEGQSAAVIEALGVADVSPKTLGFVEAHGTGTPMGDPIEVNALSQVFRRDTDEQAICALGSVKTNVGHLQIASGIVGFMKTVLAVKHGVIPPTLHYQRPNPAIGLETSPFFVNTEAQAWPQSGKLPRRAGVNSLGIGGANAHVILEEAPELRMATEGPSRSRHVLTLSAREPAALLGNVDRLEKWLGGDRKTDLADLCYTFNVGRKQFGHRAAVTAGSIPELRSAIKELHRRLLVGEAVAKSGNVAPENVCFVFTGQGAQYPGMGRELYETYSVFRETFDCCVAALEGDASKTLRAMLDADESQADVVNRTENAQPYLFAFEYSLAQLWLSLGVRPAALVGHSVGEYVAACLAGVFSLEEGIRLIAVRGKLMGELPGGGGMAAVFASERDVKAGLEDAGITLNIAAINSPEHTVITGSIEEIEKASVYFKKVGSKELKVSHAFHSELLRPALEAFEAHLDEIDWHEPKVPIYSNLTGNQTSEMATPAYWLSQARQPVRFAAAVEAVIESGTRTFLELGPRGVLVPFVARILEGDKGEVFASVRAGRGEVDQWVDTVAALFRLGLDIDWAAFDAPFERRRISAPTYAFQRKRYWLDIRPARGMGGRGGEAPRGTAGDQWPLSRGQVDVVLGDRIPLPLIKEAVFKTVLDAGRIGFLNDHKIFGSPVVPGAVYVSMALAAAKRLGYTSGSSIVLEGVAFQRALVLPNAGEGAAIVHLSIGGKENGRRGFRLACLGDDPHSSTLHCEGSVGASEDSALLSNPPRAGFEASRNGCSVGVPPADFYGMQASRSIELGDSYRWIREIWRGARRAVCRIEAPTGVNAQLEGAIHPGLLDACFGLLVASVDMDVDESLVPFRIERVEWVTSCSGNQYWAEATLSQETDAERGRLVGSITLYDIDNRVVARLTDLEGRRASRTEIMGQILSQPQIPTWESEWSSVNSISLDGTSGAMPTGPWLVVSLGGLVDEGRLAATRLQNGGATVLEWVLANDDVKGADIRIRPSDVTLMAEQLSHVEGLAGVVVVVGDGGEERLSLQSGYSLIEGLSNLLKVLAGASLDSGFSISLLTSRAFPENDRVAITEPFSRSLWGLLRSVEVEFPNWTVRYLDCDLAVSDAGRVLDQWLTGASSASGWRFHSGQLERLRLRRRFRQIPGGASVMDRVASGTGGVLIVGGTGALGLQMAEWFVGRGIGPLYLLSRSGETPSIAKAVGRISSDRNVVRVVQGDAADAVALAEVVRQIEAEDAPIRGVIHAAGILHDAVVAEQTWETIEPVLNSKIAVAANLDAQFGGRELDFFLLFSSAAGVLGNPGQSNYSSANAYLDGLAAARQARGFATTSVAWGPWDSAGMADSEPTLQLFQTVGIKPIPTANGVQMLDFLIESRLPHTMVMDIDWSKYLKSYPSRRAFVPDGTEGDGSEPIADTGGAAEFLVRLQDVSNAKEFSVAVGAIVSETAQSVLAMGDTVALSSDVPLMDQGLDSLMAVELRNKFSSGFGLTLPVGLVFSCPTIESLTEYLVDQVREARGVGTSPHPPEVVSGGKGEDYSYLEGMSSAEIENLLDEELQ